MKNEPGCTRSSSSARGCLELGRSLPLASLLSSSFDSPLWPPSIVTRAYPRWVGYAIFFLFSLFWPKSTTQYLLAAHIPHHWPPHQTHILHRHPHPPASTPHSQQPVWTLWSTPRPLELKEQAGDCEEDDDELAAIPGECCFISHLLIAHLGLLSIRDSF